MTLTVAVLAAADPRVVDDRLRRAAELLPGARPAADDAATWRNTAGTVAVLTWDSVDAHAGADPRVVADADRLTALTGHAWAGADATAPSWAARLHDRLGKLPLADVRDQLFGVFAAVDARADGATTAAVDNMGVGSLYVSRGDRLTVVSSRATVAAALADGTSTPAADPLGAGWLTFMGYPFGAHTSLVGTVRLQGHEVVTIAADGTARIVAGRRVVESDSRLDGTFDDWMAAAEQDLMATMTSVAGIDTARLELPMSGGKDSRVVVALARASGVLDRAVAVTTGEEHDEDVIVARMVTAAVRVRHEVTPPRPRVFDSSSTYVDALLAHLRRYDGMLDPNDVRGPEPERARDVLVLGGAFGELFRCHYRGNRDITGRLPATWAMHGVAEFDPLGVMRAEAEVHYRRALREWVDERLDSGAAPADLPDLFYLDQRVSRFLGAQQERPPHLLVNPLKSSVATRAGFTMARPDRRAARMHRALLERLGPDLLAVPFAGDAEVAARAAALRSGPAVPRPDRHAMVVGALREHVLSEPGHRIYDIVDPARLRAAVAGPPTARGTRGLARLLGTALWLGTSTAAPELTPVPFARVRRKLVRLQATAGRAWMVR